MNSAPNFISCIDSVVKKSARMIGFMFYQANYEYGFKSFFRFFTNGNRNKKLPYIIYDLFSNYIKHNNFALTVKIFIFKQVQVMFTTLRNSYNLRINNFKNICYIFKQIKQYGDEYVTKFYIKGVTKHNYV